MTTETIIDVRYPDCDMMGGVHHAVYPVWFEVGRTDFIRLFGTSYSEMEQSGIMTPLRNLSCHFKFPAQYEDKLIVRTWCINLTAARIEFAYSVKRINDDGTENELAYGNTEHGFVDAKTFRPCNAKKRMPQLYEKMNSNIKIIG